MAASAIRQLWYRTQYLSEEVFFMSIVKTQIRLSLVAIGLVVTLLVGCKIVSPGASYNFIALEAVVSATPEQITEAAKATLEDMKLILVSADSTGLDGQIIARTARKKTVTVTVMRQARNISHIKIQVGRLGDEATSLLILERIKERLM